MADDVPSKTRVDVKTAWASKINWTQGVSLAATLLALKGINLDSQTQVEVVVGIQAVQAVITWVLRTFFTKSITPSSL